MQVDPSILTSSEFNTRKFWKKCFFIFYGLVAVFALMWSVFFLSGLEGNPEQLGAATANGILFIVFPAFIFYYSAYKKAGTFLLTLYLFVKPVDFAVKGFAIFYLPFPYNIVFFGLMLSISIFFYVLNWKLRKINKKMQLNEKIYPKEYILETNTLSIVTSKDDLNTYYAALVQKWPQFEKYSTHLYNLPIKISLIKHRKPRVVQKMDEKARSQVK